MSNPQTNKRLTATDWAHIVTLYERGEKNLRELSDQFGVTLQAISQGLKARGVKKGSRLDEVAGEVSDIARQERERKVKQANQQVEQYAKYYDAIAKLTMKKVIEASANNGSVAIVNADVLTLKNAIATIRTAREESWEIQKLDELLGDLAELPDLNVGEYTPEEIEKIREANEEGYLEGLDDEEDFVEGFDDEEDDEPEED